MDIIVIKNEGEKYSGTSFRVRFGTLKILKAREKIVKIKYITFRLIFL
jgi:phosphatidate phosphatase PAH1